MGVRLPRIARIVQFTSRHLFGPHRPPNSDAAFSAVAMIAWASGESTGKGCNVPEVSAFRFPFSPLRTAKANLTFVRATASEFRRVYCLETALWFPSACAYFLWRYCTCMWRAVCLRIPPTRYLQTPHIRYRLFETPL